MSNIVKGNKNSASEDDMGELHGLITTVFTRHLKRINELLDAGADPSIIVDPMKMSNPIKWVQANGIVCADPADKAGNELANELAEIKRKQHMRLVSNGPSTFTEADEE
ncbi:terminase small subunit [Aeromonas phage vB_AspA_Tola]|nr:terminase small subunit [Aeromonas phage vB_AspA_Tola]